MNDVSVQDRIIKDIAKKYKLDYRHVKNIVYYPFKFAKAKMSDPLNERPIRIKYFGVFTQKHILNKDFYFKTKTEAMLDSIEDVAVIMSTVLGYQIISLDSAKNIITTALEQKDYEKLQTIWDELRYYNRKL
jgi:hypothetical protein